MKIEKKIEEIKLSLADLRVEVKHLMSNIDIAISHLEEVHTEEDAKQWEESYGDIEKDLKHIEIFW